jgi:small-conductance mechanosensitive channel
MVKEEKKIEKTTVSTTTPTHTAPGQESIAPNSVMASLSKEERSQVVENPSERGIYIDNDENRVKRIEKEQAKLAKEAKK